MSDNTTDASSATSPWVRAAMATVIGTLVYFYLSGASVGQALIFGILFFGVFGFILSRMATKREKTEQAASAASAAVTQAVEKSGVSPTAEPAPIADPAPVNEDPLVKPSTPLPGQAELADRDGEWSYMAPAETDAPQDTTPSAAAENEEQLIKPSTALPGQAELSGRKGTWRYDPNPTPT